MSICILLAIYYNFINSYVYIYLAFGPTVSEIDISKALGVFEKTSFSMIIPEVGGILKKDKETRKSVVIFGIQVNISNLALERGWDKGS